MENVTQITGIMSKFLKKYAGHSQIETSKVMDMIPAEWNVMNNEDFNGVYSFILNGYSTSLHKTRIAKMARYLSEIERLNSEYKLIESQSAYTTIMSLKVCEVCQKTIGKQVFVVFPNGVVVHHMCASANGDLTVCPTTKQNFEKTYRD